MTVEIRDITSADHAAWLPLWRAYQVFYNVDLPETVTATLWSRLLDTAEPVHAALAWDGATAVGLAQWLTHRSTWSVENLCYLNDLYVSESARGGGVGEGLIRYVYTFAELAGCARVYWLTHESNATARALYDRVAARTGFLHYGRRLGSAEAPKPLC
jgi:GNAT superfamily N-acetyltransferase